MNRSRKKIKEKKTFIYMINIIKNKIKIFYLKIINFLIIYYINRINKFIIII